MIWLELKFKNGKKLIYGAMYREFKLARQENNQSASHEAQLERWNRMTESWVKAGREGEVIVMGDLNLDWKK